MPGGRKLSDADVKAIRDLMERLNIWSLPPWGAARIVLNYLQLPVTQRCIRDVIVRYTHRSL